MAKRLIFTTLTLIIAAIAGTIQAQTITRHLQGTGSVAVHQPQALEQRLSPASGDSTNVATHHHGGRADKNVVGYRIQVFSDRNQRTAKGEALAKERNIKEAFPDLGTYISYDAPSWRLRVGDYRTRDEAAARMADLKERFPAFANEMIIVVDVIKVSSN